MSLIGHTANIGRFLNEAVDLLAKSKIVTEIMKLLKKYKIPELITGHIKNLFEKSAIERSQYAEFYAFIDRVEEKLNKCSEDVVDVEGKLQVIEGEVFGIKQELSDIKKELQRSRKLTFAILFILLLNIIVEIVLSLSR